MLGIARSTLAYQPVPESDEDRRIKRLMDEIYLRDACLGTRRLVTVLERDHGLVVNRKRLQRLRREMGLETIYCRPRTSVPDREHVKFPCLLRELAVTRPNQVWCADITYVPMPYGHAFLCAVMDWHSRKVLGWALSNTMDVALCVAALSQAVGDGGELPEIMNTDQGSQFTSVEWIQELQSRAIAVSMDGKGRGWTTCLSRGCGEASNTRTSTCASMRASPHWRWDCGGGSSNTTAGGHTPRWVEKLRRKPTGKSRSPPAPCPWKPQHDPGSNSQPEQSREGFCIRFFAPPLRVAASLCATLRGSCHPSLRSKKSEPPRRTPPAVRPLDINP